MQRVPIIWVTNGEGVCGLGMWVVLYQELASYQQKRTFWRVCVWDGGGGVM